MARTSTRRDSVTNCVVFEAIWSGGLSMLSAKRERFCIDYNLLPKKCQYLFQIAMFLHLPEIFYHKTEIILV